MAAKLARSFKFAHQIAQTKFIARAFSPDSTYGGRHTVTLIPGHGIGPGLIEGIEEVFRKAGVPMDFEVANLAGETPEEIMSSFQDVKTAVQRNGTAIKGNWTTEINRIHGAAKSFNVALRHDLELYANVVKCKSYPTIKTRHNNVDLIIIRENTEGEYSNLEHENISGVIEMMKIITEDHSKRIAKFAFEYARNVAKNYPDIDFNDMIIDNCAMQMVSKPEQFDVMVMPNLYGNVITNIAAALVGGPGIPPGENHGDLYHIFESGTRNTGKDIAEKNIANPMSMLFASTSMLRHLGLNKHAHLIDVCINRIVTSNQARTFDIGGTTTTDEFFDFLTTEIEEIRHRRRSLK